MKKYAMAACLFMAALNVCAQTKEKDSLRVIDLQEVEIISTRATGTTPVAFTNINKDQLKKQNFGQDLPYLLSMTPSAITTSDAGAGIGYTTLRVRGTDGTRINVTANGIPINDAESHNVFWVNLPDFASSVKDMQIQRGAGTSTNGAGAFGASINMQTGDFSLKPYAELNGSYGSFNTHKETVKVGTGLINDHWSFDARLSNISSDGYIDRASVGLNSYYLQGGYYNDNTSVKLITFGGKERTYHAWNYASKEEMKEYGRRYNSCGYMYTDDNGTAHYYEDQTDNYVQKNYQLLFNHNFTSAWNVNAGLHYTKGDGYYQEYKDNRKLVEYGLLPYEHDGETVKKSDLIRKKAMDNWFGGGIFSVNYKGSRLHASLGGGLNRYDGDHFGRVMWAKQSNNLPEPDYEYYRNTGDKLDYNMYAKANYQSHPNLSGYLDIQYRGIHYTIEGSDDKAGDHVNVDKHWNFFNPKAGINFQKDGHNAFVSFSVANREPNRDNFTEAGRDERPQHETLYDYEAGYGFGNSRFHVGANLYFMDYSNQLILTGKISEIGEALTSNIKDSYRMGIELTGGVKIARWLDWSGNLTLSRNKIKNFTESIEVYDADWNFLREDHNDLGTTDIAFSPDIIANSMFDFNLKGFSASFNSQFVGRQYIDNTSTKDRSIDPYFVNSLRVGYVFKPKFMKEIALDVTINNLFNEQYETNAWVYSAMVDGERYKEDGYFTQAGTNAMARVTFKF